MPSNRDATKVMFGQSLMYPSQYLAAEDLRGRDHRVRIRSVELTDLKTSSGDTETKGVIGFDPTPDLPAKKMILNKTNAKRIARCLDEAQAKNWVGQSITIYATEVEFAGNDVLAIRVRSDGGGDDEISNGNGHNDDHPTPQPAKATTKKGGKR